MKKYYDNNGIENLSNAIVLKAFDDYMSAIKGKGIEGKQPSWVKDECKEFFNSDWCGMISGTPADVFIREAHNRVIDEYEKKIKEYEKKIKKVKKMLEKEEEELKI